MKKIVLILISFLFAIVTNAQVDTTRPLTPVSGVGYVWNQGEFRYKVKIPNDTFRLKMSDSGSLANKNGIVYKWNGYQWLTIFSGSGGTGTVTDVNTGYGLTGGPITDNGTISADTSGGGLATQFMLSLKVDSITNSTDSVFYWKNGISNYAFKIISTFDTTTIYANLDLKLNKSDTSSMLSPYINNAINGLTKSGKTIKQGGTLTENTAINGAGFDFSLGGTGITQFTNGANIIYQNSTGTGIDANNIVLDPQDSIRITNLVNTSTLDALLGFKTINGKLGRLNLGGGLGILSGALTVTAPLGTDTSTTTGFGINKTIAGNNIELKVDSNQVATKYSVDSMRNNIYGQINTTNAQVTANTAAITQRPTFTQLSDSLNGKQDVLEHYGNWISTAFPSTSLPADWQSFSFANTVNDGITFSGNGGTYCTGFLYNTKYSGSLNYTTTLDFTLNTKPSVYNDGIFTGRRSANTAQSTQNAIATKVVDANNFRLIIDVLYACTVNGKDSSLVLPMVVGGKYRMYIAGSNTNLYAKLSLLAANGRDSISVATNHKYSYLAANLEQPANTGSEWLAATGSTGNYTVTNLETKNYDFKNVHTLFVGNSVGTRYDATSLQNHYTTLSMQNSGLTWANMSGGGDRFNELNLKLNQILAYNPKYVIVEAGINDNYVDIRTQATPFFDSLIAHNINVVWLKLFNTVSKDTIFYNLCKEKNIVGVDAFRTNMVLGTTDGVHLNDKGNEQVTYILKSECPQATGKTGGNELPIQGTLPIEVGITDINSGTNDRILIQSSNKLQQDAALVWNNTNNHLIVDGKINVGNGNAPLSTMDVNGSLRITGFTPPASGESLEQHYLSNQGYIYAYNRSTSTARDLIIGSNGQQIFAKANGLVGVNNNNPTANLHSIGTLRIETGNQGANKILQSDVSGNADWVTPSFLTSETDPVVKAINGLVKSNGTTISAAVAGTDYLTPTGSAAALTSFPTFNQNTTGTASNIIATSNSTLTSLPSLTLPTTQLSGTITNAQIANTAVASLSGTNTGDNAVNTTYANDYRAANFVAGTNYLAPTGNGSGLTGLTGSQITGDISGNASNVTGTIAVANGGTGANTLTGIMVGNGTSAVTAVEGTAGQFLRRNAGNTAYEFATLAGGGDALTTNPLSQFASTTSAQLAGVISDESGTGNLVYNTAPTITNADLAGEIDLKGITSPAQYTTDQNDVAYTGSTIVRVNTNSDARVISSVSGGADGRVLKIINVGSSDLIIQSDDGATGTAANRFDFNGTDVIIEPKESREFIYDATTSRWLKTTYEYDLTNVRRQPIYNWDYMLAGVATANFPTTAISTGTATYTNGTTDHPGYMQTSSSATTNSGNHSYLYNLQNNLLFKGGEVYECIYQPRVASNTNTTTRFGFLDATTSADAVDGAYFEIPAGSFAVVGKTSNNSTRTTSATISTIAVNTWYRFVIKVNRAASSITFTIYDANGVSLGSQTNSANIPKTAGREFGVGYISTNVGTTATALGWLDYQSVQLSASKPLNR